MFIFVLFSLQFQLYKLKENIWCAWDSNPWPHDGRHRRYHGAMAAAQDSLNLFYANANIFVVLVGRRSAADVRTIFCYSRIKSRKWRFPCQTGRRRTASTTGTQTSAEKGDFRLKISVYLYFLLQRCRLLHLHRMYG